MSGDLDMPEAHWVATQLAERGIVVVSVDYSLSPYFDFLGTPARHPAPGVRFPVAHDEVVAVFRQVHGGAVEFGIDASNLSLGGASAGANLAAGASLELRDLQGAIPRTVLLAYPAVHVRVPPPSPDLEEALRAVDDSALFPAARLEALVENYVGEQGIATHRYAFPGGHDLHGLPPTLVITSDADSLRPSGEAYAAELAAAGVDVLMVRERGTLHGHLNRPAEAAALRSVERLAAWVHATTLVG